VTLKSEITTLEQKFGFNTEETINRHQRIIMAISGPEKSGKTSFGLSMPKPLAYFNFDRKLEEVGLTTIGVSEDDIIAKHILVSEGDNQAVYKKKWNEFTTAFRYVLFESREIRSILVDTETDMWELIRLAEFGKLTEIMPYMYKQVNTPYRALLNECHKGDKNIIFTRKVKRQYKNDKWTGKMDVAGQGQVKDIVQVNATMFWDDDGANITIVNNGLNATINGDTYAGEGCVFPVVAEELTGIDAVEWL
jgi:hypothetical protein